MSTFTIIQKIRNKIKLKGANNIIQLENKWPKKYPIESPIKPPIITRGYKIYVNYWRIYINGYAWLWTK